jgi:hypothetical protein
MKKVPLGAAILTGTWCGVFLDGRGRMEMLRCLLLTCRVVTTTRNDGTMEQRKVFEYICVCLVLHFVLIR